MLLWLSAQDVISKDKLRTEVQACRLLIRIVCLSHRVHHVVLVFQICACGIHTSLSGNPVVHRIELICVIAVRIFTIDGQVWHLTLSDTDSIACVVKVTVCIVEVKVRRNLDTVRHVVVESHTSSETIHALLDDVVAL